MMKLYQEKKCYPSGIYRKAYEDWLANQSGNNTNRSSGRVNMIQLTHNTGKASILAVDTAGLDAHYLTRKVYLTIGVARANLPDEYNMTGLYDTAADQSLISSSYFASVFNIDIDSVDKYLEPSTMELASYSGHKIAVAGVAKLLVRLIADGPFIPIKFTVVADVNNTTTPLIIGMPAIRKLQLSLSFNDSETESPPFVYTQFKPGQPLNSGYLSDLDKQTATNLAVYLEPGESKFIPVDIPHFFGIYPGMETIFTEDNLSSEYNVGIKVFPTKSELKLNDQNTLTGHVYVTNMTNKIIKKGFVVAYFEPASLYNVKSVDYTFPKDQQVIHEIGVFRDHDYPTMDSKLQKHENLVQ